MKNIFSMFVVVCWFSFAALAQDINAQSSGFTADIMAEMEYVQGQVLQLADAFPEDKYSWSPSEGVRSVGDLFKHIVEGNYFALGYIGAKAPEGGSMESMTKKADIINALKKSYEFSKNALMNYKEENLDNAVDFFGMKSNQRRMIILLLYHNHEHLGQAIAYARMNGITPPWSMASGK